MAGDFADKVVMISGAAGQIARAIVLKFAQQGAQLVLVDASMERLEARVEELRGQLGEYLLLTGDLGNPADVNAIVEQAEARFGKIDVLVHTAGGFAAGKPVHELDLDTFDRMMLLNARITYITLGRVARHMVEKGVKGSLVAVLARSGLKGAKNTAAYTASKAAAQRIVESMALELRDYDIRVNGVMPSTADTPANRQSMPNADFDKWVKPEQLADTIAFLASDAASAISGESLGVYNKA
jgi:NAD(P)-dependent dehydrogenase (short-subunit alcohol dehydrogenase family)